MSLRRLVVENYRCFRDRQEITLAPVTVVLGKNNSGKSVLTRAPLVIATGFGTDTSAPLALEQLGTDAVDAFTDLIFEQSPHGRIRLGVQTSGVAGFDLSATVQNVDEIRAAVVSELRLRTREDEFQLVWRPAMVFGPGPMDYEIHTAHQSVVRPLMFRGLLPDPVGVPELRPLRGMNLAVGPIRYLSPYRKRPGRQHRLPLGTPHELGALGEGVPAILAHDQVRGGGELIGMVNRRLRAIVPGWRLQEVAAGPLWSTVLSRGDGGRVQVNLADAGSGLAQVLPILVQCALDELRGHDTAALQIIEEPEMHLHPAAHAELADLYLRTAKDTKTQFLIETHSETLLLRLRRRIAAGEAPPEMVAIYVVEQADGVSTVRRVEIDDMGNLDGWPDGYFSQDYVEARALAEAQLKRSHHAA